jgi:hypothetical protein
MSSGAEALELSMNSERLFSDLLLALKFPDLWTLAFVAREFDSRIPFSVECRCFLHDNKLTAISQY